MGRPAYAVNCSTLFTELPLLQRPAAAARAGFSAVEFWWPFDSPTPPERETKRFVSAIRDAGVRLIQLNIYAGDMAGGERGVVSLPGREQEFRDGVAAAVEIGSELDCRLFNALYGLRRPAGGSPLDEQDDLATANLAFAAATVDSIDGTVMIEPLSGIEAYPIKTAAQALAVAAKANAAASSTRVRLLADLYHLAVNGEDLVAVLPACAEWIAHVQIADAPGRGAPGTGSLDLSRALNLLEAQGYSGWVALEYLHSGSTTDSFGWLPREDRGCPTRTG